MSKKFENVLVQGIVKAGDMLHKLDAQRESTQELFNTKLHQWLDSGRDLDNSLFAQACREIKAKCTETEKGKEKVSKEGNKLMSAVRVRLMRACEALRETHSLENAYTIKHTKDRGYFMEPKDFKEPKSDPLIEAVKAFKQEPTDISLRDRIHHIIDNMSEEALKAAAEKLATVEHKQAA